MRCSACAAHVPFWGERCPFCGQEKSLLQVMRVLGIGCVLAGALVGHVRGGMTGLLLGIVVGGVLWGCSEFTWDRLMRLRNGKSKHGS